MKAQSQQGEKHHGVWKRQVEIDDQVYCELKATFGSWKQAYHPCGHNNHRGEDHTVSLESTIGEVQHPYEPYDGPFGHSIV